MFSVAAARALLFGGGSDAATALEHRGLLLLRAGILQLSS
jgi:hypothetical protein